MTKRPLGFGTFESFFNPENGSQSEVLFKLFRIAIFLTMLAFGALGMLLFWGVKIEAMGQSADFFTGYLTPFLTLLTFGGVLYTVWLQRADLKVTRNDALAQSKLIERQNFETTFFDMMAVHSSAVDGMRASVIRSGTGLTTLQGRDVFGKFYDDFRLHVRLNSGDVTEGYKAFWRENRGQLGHYFRYLYNIVRFLDERDYETARYMRFVRAQLSDFELLLLAYNCSFSEFGAKFLPLVEKHHLLNNIPRDELIESWHLNFISKSAFADAGEQHG